MGRIEVQHCPLCQLIILADSTQNIALDSGFSIISPTGFTDVSLTPAMVSSILPDRGRQEKWLHDWIHMGYGDSRNLMSVCHSQCSWWDRTPNVGNFLAHMWRNDCSPYQWVITQLR